MEEHNFQYVDAFCRGLTGWTLEAGGAMLLAGIVVVMFTQFYRKDKIYMWEITGFIGALVGYALMIFAPGNFARSEIVAELGGSNRSFLIEILYRIARETYYMFIHMWPLLLIITILILLLIENKSWKEMLSEYRVAILVLALAMLGVYVMTLSSAYAERMLVTPIAYAIIAFGILYKSWRKKANKAILICCICFGCMVMGIQCITGVYQMRDGDKMLDIHTEYISSEF